MPNGNPSFDSSELEQFFAPIAQAVHQFALNKNLLLEKYYHDGPQWSLRFNHPRGGQASIELRRGDRDRLFVSSIWHLDDYDTFTRSLYWGSERECRRDPSIVVQSLEDEFGTLVSMELGNWNQIASDYGNIWRRYSKQEFESMTPKYPYPNPDETL